MTRASRDQITQAREFVRNNPQANVSDVIGTTGVSDTTARRLLGARAEPDAGEGETSSDSSGWSPPPRKATKTKRRIKEPNESAVETLYGLTCTIAAIATAPIPSHLKLTETDKEMILRPACRMYLRRKSVPDVSPDARDMMTILIGVVTYGFHATSRHAGYEPRPTQPGRDRPASGPPPAMGNGAPAPSYDGGSGATEVSANQYDPAVIMARFEEELQRASDAEENAAVDGTDRAYA